MSESKNAVGVVEVKRLRPMLQEFNNLLGRHINERERYKLGRVLTIIDASFNDPEQRKAVKDLVQSEWWGSNRGEPSTVPMESPHTDIRGMALALGFDLYPPTEHGQLMEANSVDREKWAHDRYATAADNANKSK